MSSLKILTAAVAAATFGLAFAQGTPPRPATDPAVGAGQRSTHNTPMGSTGTPGGGLTLGTRASGAGAATTGSMGATTGSTMNSAPMDTGTAATTTTRSTTVAQATTTHTHKAKHKKKAKHHVAKADRN